MKNAPRPLIQVVKVSMRQSINDAVCLMSWYTVFYWVQIILGVTGLKVAENIFYWVQVILGVKGLKLTKIDGYRLSWV